MDFTLLQPAGADHQAGGGAYLRALLDALSMAGHRCRVQTGTTWPPGSIAVIDGLGLGRFSPDDVEGAVALIHHLAPLAPEHAKEAVHAAERALLPRFRCVVATNRPVAQQLEQEFGVAPERIAVVTPGVVDVPRNAGADPSVCRVLSVGAAVPRKGHAVLLQALARLFDLPWRLTVVGDLTRDPAHAAALQAQAERDAPGRVHFTGTLPAAALDAEWRRATLFALASEWEGYAAPVAEALRRGIPVAVTSGGAAADLVQPEFGVVCPPGDAEGLSKAMRRLIFDGALQADMAQAAWQAGQALPGWPEQAARFAEFVS